MLGTLAKWLRILGYDCVFDTSLNDHQLVRLARAEDRMLLTRDTELARRRGLCVMLIEAEVLDDQIRQVLDSLDLAPQRSRSRCSICNERLEPLDHKDAAARVPPYVAQTQRLFRACPACGRVYWPGTHWRKIDQRLAEFDSD
jgi:uncharacterized protein with PIN domain